MQKVYEVTINYNYNLDCPGEEDHVTKTKLFSTKEKAQHYLLNGVKNDFSEWISESLERDPKDDDFEMNDEKTKLWTKLDWSAGMEFSAEINERNVH